MQTIRSEFHASPFWMAVFGSFLFHLLFLFFPYSSGNLSPSAHAPLTRVRWIEPKSMPDKGQIVDVMNNQKSETAPNTPFLSDQNRRVDKETQARITGANPQSAIGSLGIQNHGKYNLNAPSQFLKPHPKSGPRSGQQSAMAPSNYLPNIDIGDETILNTREYAFTSYFIRMKRQIEGNWNPLHYINHYARNPDEYVTAVQITLKPDGYVEKIEIISSSGNSGLDLEAMQAIRQGGPYLNPPKEIADADGKIRIGPWRFIVSMRARL